MHCDTDAPKVASNEYVSTFACERLECQSTASALVSGNTVHGLCTYDSSAIVRC